MPFKINLLQDLNIIKDENGAEWINFMEFTHFLKNRKLPSEPNLKNSNIFVWLKGKDCSVKELNGDSAFSVQSVIHFFFSYARQYDICFKISRQIQKYLIKDEIVEKENVSSVFEIYKLVANEKLFSKLSMEKIIIDSSKLETLSVSFKENFNKEEWAKICFFEHHFQRNSSVDIVSETYETLLSKKALFFKKLVKAKDTAHTLAGLSNPEICNRLRRKEIAEYENDINIFATKKHSPLVLEQDILDNIPDASIIQKIFCLDCTRRCPHSSCLHVYIETIDEIKESFPDIATTICATSEKRHGEVCGEIISFKSGTFSSYIDFDGEVKRFQMRDDLLTGKLQNYVDNVWQNKSIEEIDQEDDATVSCNRCFSAEFIKPLCMKSFDIFHEWYIETPLICQLIFESFINKYTMMKADDKEAFIIKKYKRLYSQYDALLNVSNRTYFGLVQDMNTQELTMNYQSISSVFNVTTSSGLTQCITTAEENLKKKAHSEKTYYNTYLRKYPLLYTTAAGQKSEQVSLRDCVLILMMDNLVRLKKRADPNPGESRTMQLCTLPITLKGIPIDSSEVEGWHMDDCAIMDIDCMCKKPVQLSSNDMNVLLLTMSSSEMSLFTNFKKLCCFGTLNVWKKIFKDEVHCVNMDNIISAVDMSLASLQLDDVEMEAESLDSEVIESESFHAEDVDNEDLDLSEINLKDIEVQNEDISTDDNDTLEDSFILNVFTSDDENDDNDDEQTNNGDELFLNEKDESKKNEYQACERLHDLLRMLGFVKFKFPAFLTKHPPPAIGRDDDIKKLKEVLDDITIKSDSIQRNSHKILFAPDHKIASNLFKLQETNKKYNSFLPEFPCLHLRKSKITILCSSYKDAGILHILKYMRDEEFQEWRKLISAEHIEMATRYIRRISIALHIAFFIKYLQALEPNMQELLQKRLIDGEQTEQDWVEFEKFLENGRQRNGTFALHYDLMVHCSEVGAIALAERLGGENGYTLLLAAVKSSLPFSFMNGASSYAAFTTKLLHEYYKCGPYYRNMKHTLFSTPIPGSEVNFALDTQREIDHQNALKAFRSGSTVKSILPRMSLLDSLNEVHEESIQSKPNSSGRKRQVDFLGVKMTSTDDNYILKVVSLVLRQDGISTTDDATVYNVYDAKKPVLSLSILDKTTDEVGKYLIRKYVANNNLFGCSKIDEPDLNLVHGPKELLQKVKMSRGVTIKRTSIKKSAENKTIREKKEEKRVKHVRQEVHKIDCLSSDMNACQAIVKPDCSKPKVMKASGVRIALLDILTKYTSVNILKPDRPEKHLEENNLVHLSKKSFPEQLTQTATVATIEFAGMKFKTKSSSGTQYIKYIENAVLMKTKIQFPNVHHMAICEEKYQFTPDDFKSATRAQRQKTSHCSITHLKTSDEILGTNKFDKKSITSSAEGKYLISTYLAKHMNEVNFQANVTVDVDSELNLTTCDCERKPCIHPNNMYTHPLRAIFSTELQPRFEVLEGICQTKGEAEMAQIDWLIEYEPLLDGPDSAVSIVTSGDIDAVVLHIFAVASFWPRAVQDKKCFRNEVYVILQKPGNLFDIYNITGIVSLLEKGCQDQYIGQKVALVLSLGGNDFLPKFHGISHKKTLQVYMSQAAFRSNLFKFETKQQSTSDFSIKFDPVVYKDLIKYIYTPKHLDPDKFTYEEIRQLSILPPRAKSLLEYKNPQNWMPPASAIDQLSKNVCCLVEYYLTAGKHEAPLPNFIEKGCLQRLPDGTIEYNLGMDSSIKKIQETFSTDHTDLLDRIKQHKKRKQEDTPQKGARRKLKPKATSTPKKKSGGME